MTSVSDATARSFSTEKERMKESSTAWGNLRTNFSAPPSGEGSAPARSVSLRRGDGGGCEGCKVRRGAG